MCDYPACNCIGFLTHSRGKDNSTCRSEIKGHFKSLKNKLSQLARLFSILIMVPQMWKFLAAGGCLFQKLPVRSFDDHHHFSRLSVSASYIFIIGSMWFSIAITYIYSMLISFITNSRRLFKSITLCEVITNAAAVLTHLLILHTKPSVGEGAESTGTT